MRKTIKGRQSRCFEGGGGIKGRLLTNFQGSCDIKEEIDTFILLVVSYFSFK